MNPWKCYWWTLNDVTIFWWEKNHTFILWQLSKYWTIKDHHQEFERPQIINYLGYVISFLLIITYGVEVVEYCFKKA